MSKRVLVFSTAYFPLVGGAEVAIKEITDRLNGWQFDLITARIKPNLAKFEKCGVVNVYRLGLGLSSIDKLFLPLLGFLKARQLDKKNDYQLFWAVMASQSSIAACFLKMFNRKKKFLMTLQEGDPEEHLKRYVFGLSFLYKLLIRPWHLLPFRLADYFTVISHDLKRRALANKVKAPIEIIPNGVCLDKFTDIKPDQNLKSELGILSDEKVIITSSRLVKKNAIDDLIRSITYLKDKQVKLLIMGDGVDQQKLERLAGDLKIKDRVIFFGRYNNDDLPKYLSISDVFVRPSLSEGQGISFLEAMAAGIPVVGTPVGGIVDFLKDPSTSSGRVFSLGPGQATGLFCQVRDPQSIANQVRRLLEDEGLRQKIIVNARELMEKEYSWDSIALKMVNVFNKLV